MHKWFDINEREGYLHQDILQFLIENINSCPKMNKENIIFRLYISEILSHLRNLLALQ